MRILNIVIAIILCMPLTAQIQFFEEYSGEGEDFGQGIVQLPDSSYVITGASSSFSSFQTDAFLLCIDSMGIYKWSTYFGGEETDWGRRVMYSENDGFYVAGYTNSSGEGAYDFYLVKTDLGGYPTWEKTYGGTGWDRVMDAALLRDTGVLMVGETGSNAGSDQDIYFVRTDKNGDTLWTRTIENQGDDISNSLVQWNDSTFIVASTFYISDSTKNKALLTCIVDDGTILWEDTIGANGNYIFYDLLIDNDTLQCVGSHQLDENDDIDIYRYSYNLLTKSEIYEIAEHNDGDFRGVGIANYTDFGSEKRIVVYSAEDEWSFPEGEDMYIRQFSQLMFFEGWWTNMARDGQDELGQIIETSDNGAIVVGWNSKRDGVEGHRIFAMKIGKDHVFPYQDEVGAVFQLVSHKEIENLVESNIYPNPASDQFTVEVDSESEVAYSILDMNGKVLLTGTFFGSSIIPVTQLVVGTYLVELTQDYTRILIDRIVIR